MSNPSERSVQNLDGVNMIEIGLGFLVGIVFGTLLLISFGLGIFVGIK